MQEVPTGEIEQPQFCPWCGAPAPYRREKRTPLERRLADEATALPEAVEESLHTEAYATGCAGCRRVSHVIGHRTEPDG